MRPKKLGHFFRDSVSSRQAGRATDAYDCFRKRGLRRRLRADRSAPLGDGCSSLLVWCTTAWRRAAASFIRVRGQSTHRSWARGCGGGGGGAKGRREKKKKRNLGSDLNLASTGVWPCRNDSCACDVRRPCVRYWLPPRHRCHRASPGRNPAVLRGSSALRRGHPCVEVDDFLRSVLLLCVRCFDVRFLPLRKSSQCVRLWWNPCVCVMCTPADDDLLRLASRLDVVPLARPAAGLALSFAQSSGL